jgi:16S rRNA (adenine1518-N6/adenine1519-N6)-dimethyltransferase
VKKEFNINPKVFIPPPKVQSTLITFTPIQERRFSISWDELSSLTRIAFLHPRKTIYNNFRDEFSNAEEILKNAKVEKSRRPETISLEEFVKIKESNIVFKVKSLE